MLIRDNAGVVDGAILDAQGNVVNKPTKLLTTDEARLLRQYKKFLEVHHMREAMFCNDCFDGDLSDGMKVFVTDDQILFECRHRMLFYQGLTY